MAAWVIQGNPAAIRLAAMRRFRRDRESRSDTLYLDPGCPGTERHHAATRGGSDDDSQSSSGAWVCALVLSVGVGEVARADAATATVTPATGGNGVPLVFGHAAFDLATVGYTQSEFFIEGTADAYTPVNPLTNDGKWTVAPFSPAAYKTRMVVNRPDQPHGSSTAAWSSSGSTSRAAPMPARTGSTCTSS